jgi:hypothetical protein
MNHYEIQVGEKDAALLRSIAQCSEAGETDPLAGRCATLGTDSLAVIGAWRELLDGAARPYRVFNRALNYQLDVSNPDW